jgi:hypothetical protein
MIAVTHGPDDLRTARTGPAGRVRGAALRAGSAVITRLPERPLVALAEAAGEVWYRAAPSRAAQGRMNLERVCRWLVANDMASDRVRQATGDPRSLERLLRAAFRRRR